MLQLLRTTGPRGHRGQKGNTQLQNESSYIVTLIIGNKGDTGDPGDRGPRGLVGTCIC